MRISKSFNKVDDEKIKQLDAMVQYVMETMREKKLSIKELYVQKEDDSDGALKRFILDVEWNSDGS